MVETGVERNNGLLKAYAKLNLYLAVGPKRDDSFHELLTLFQTISLYDELFVEDRPIPGVLFDSDANLKWSPENTIYRACELFEQLTGNRLYLRIFLRKRIPSGGGLGGGSSDAATILSFLASKYRVDAKAIYEISKKIGSDVPFFLKGGTAIGKGRGEILEYLKGLSEYRVSLIFPNVSVQTAYAYKLLDERGTKKILDDGNVYKLYEAFLEKNYNRIRELSKNDFEKVVSEAFPEIKGKYVEAIESLKEDAIMVRMSGSGSTLFMLYPPESKNGEYSFLPAIGGKNDDL
ncbi:4-(cytidine 5'-diphospho)-2-C-methyl-D-erythritol kinase [Kosmotoga olearia]|uniref:4-diphosphocytidyl-2-C-methyl-D-erythritol kinase n=1 Tax=Kosmotoga olearia (strain ATCC BAA-1733 / DSM 21960 / TBF 19.5.1) TaxID=521045 RepID=C5CF10_KOSOT|nr:4-(cytidine 5'-diphospho)-2-C-methyl-D-erythritol kinase [Kosmotoga olearia]ACR80279.1 4-diphosphocytidyl-2C-methyl-D-erythritol kinase [Kosmotoga olearia TBF 19.5.1]